MQNAEWKTFDFQYLQQFKTPVLFMHFTTRSNLEKIETALSR